MTQFQDKKVLVTGGTRGIGLAIALAFAAKGATVHVWGKSESNGKSAKERVDAAGRKPATFRVVDVSSFAGVQAALEAEAGFDILVNAAGITRDKLLLGMKEEDFDAVVGTNLKSVFNTSNLLMKHMIKKRWGRIINISSVLGVMGSAGQSNYCASKFGVIGFSRALAKEIASRNVTVNVIAPGFIDTDMTRSLNEEQRDAILKQIPAKALGAAEDIAHAALFLASDEAKYITGNTLIIDGGMTA